MILRHSRKTVVGFLLQVLLILYDPPFLYKESGKKLAVAIENTPISKPFLQIEPHSTTRLTITKPHQAHFLSCTATIDEQFYYYQKTDDTKYFYTWYRNDEEIEHLSRRRMDFLVFRNGTLRLPPNERASGVYRCKINADTTAMLSESVTVEYPVLRRKPNMSQSAMNISVREGHSVTFDCPVVSVPAANVSWYHGNNSAPIPYDDSRFLLLSNGSLVMKQAAPKDSGKYRCQAQNTFATKNVRQFFWMLRVDPSHLTANPFASARLLPPLQNYTQYVLAGGNLQLQCRAVVDAVPVEWMYRRTLNSAPIKLSNSSSQIDIIQANVSIHGGYYTCKTLLDNQTYQVIVAIAPSITEDLKSYDGLITASFTFRCRAIGNPKPTLTWYHNGALLTSSYTRYISGNDLYIHSFDPDEGGIYQCFARNFAGEDYTSGEIRFKYQGGEQEMQHNPLQNIRCYAHSFNTINITFDNRAMDALFIVHIVQNNPHRWISPFAPMKLNHTSFIVISSHLPIYQPFELITRVLFPVSELRSINKPHQQTIISSMRSQPVTCCTQGLLLHLVHIDNDTYVTWSQPDLSMKKYFIIQFSVNYTDPHPAQILNQRLSGTNQNVELDVDDVVGKLTFVEPLDPKAAADVLRRAEGHEISNEAREDTRVEKDSDIFSIVMPANVTGVLMQNFSRMKMRVLLITEENEDLGQDFRYVQWKIIENDTTELMNTPFHLTMVESRMLVFRFWESFNDSCVHVCHLQIHYPTISKEEPKCEQRTVINSKLVIRNLRPSELYRLHFSSCISEIFFGQLDVQTLPDPPGTISNQRVIRHNGLKLMWDPPLQPNGKVHHYNILWTLGNQTHEKNVLECEHCAYKFPNVSETAKINVTVRVVGETGVGAPIFIDLRNINHQSLEIEMSSHMSEVYSGIAIGVVLSTCCIVIFVVFIVCHRRKFKPRQPPPMIINTPTDVNFGTLSNMSMPSESAGALSAATIQQECHEMQTLIPRSRCRIELLPHQSALYQTTQLPNGNGNIPQRNQIPCEMQDTFEMSIVGLHNISQMPLCSSTPESKANHEMTMQENKPFFIAFKQTPPNVIAMKTQKRSSSLNANTSSSSADNNTALPPNSLPLVNTVSFIAGNRRSGSLSGSSAGSSNGSKKQFHANFSKHSSKDSNDGVCLLAEEEAAATLTPTSEHEIAAALLTNGLKSSAEAKIAANAAKHHTDSKSSSEQSKASGNTVDNAVTLHLEDVTPVATTTDNSTKPSKHPSTDELHQHPTTD